MFTVLLSLAAVLFSTVTPAQARLKQIAKRCSTPDCYFGYTCRCSCGGNVAHLNMYGSCYYCNPSQCSFSFPTLCPQQNQIVTAGCSANCDVSEVVADGTCQDWTTNSGEDVKYKLICDGNTFHGTMGPSCDNQTYDISGDDNTCLWTDEMGGLGLSIDCEYGISNGGIVGIVLLTVILPIFCCWACTLDEDDEDCCPGCGSRVKVRTRTKKVKIAPGAAAAPGSGSAVAVEEEEEPEQKEKVETYVEMAER